VRPDTAGKVDFRNPALPEQERVADLVARLTLKEKIGLMFFIAPGIPRLGIEPYDHGNEALHGVVRPGTSTVFPQAIALAATWNPPLIRRMADAISDEARAKHHGGAVPEGHPVSGLLTFWSPVVNMVRDPRWGRTQETYGEDPHLTAKLGVAFVRGLQGSHPRYLKAVATPKHFAGNNEEHNRFGCPVRADDRYWHEFELAGFRACIMEGRAQSIMSAYNAINGVPCSGNRWLLTDVLRGMWGFNGYVVSDCGAISNMVDKHHYVKTPEEAAAAAIHAGLDLEGGWFCKYPELFPKYLARAYRQGLVSLAAIDRSVSRVLTARVRLGMFDPPELVPFAGIKPSVVGCAKHRNLAREIARQSLVLLKNERIGAAPLLPLNAARIRKIAVVGPNAALCQFGGYSGKPVHPAVSPLAGIRARLGATAEIVHVPWLSESITMLPSDRLSPPAGCRETSGLLGQYFANRTLGGKPLATRVDSQLNFSWGNIEPDPYASAKRFSVRWTGTLKPPVTGAYTLFLSADGGLRVRIGEQTLLEAWNRRNLRRVSCKLEMQAGRDYPIVIEYTHDGGSARMSLEWQTPGRLDEWTEQISKADAVVAVMGLGTHIEEEGRDRVTLALPVEQERFVRKIMKLNPRTVAVLESGSPLAVPWLHKTVPSILMAWYPGEQGGHAIADVLFGDCNPAGRLPVTFYKSDRQLRPFDEYDITKGRTYMYLAQRPLYVFGHGLSYTRFAYGKMKVADCGDLKTGAVTVSVEVRNTGTRDGDEVVQLYVRDVKCSVKQPRRQLKAFERVHLKRGERKIMALTVSIKDLAFWEVQSKSFVVEAGEFEFQVGASSGDIRRTARIRLDSGIRFQP